MSSSYPVIDVIGKPYPKGSMIPGVTKGGRGFLRHEADFELSRWVGKVRDAAVDVWGRPLLDTPSLVTLLFRCPVPSREYHEKDLDKLVRAVLDALTAACAYRDDKHVSTVLAHKIHVGARAPTFGCRMQIARLEDCTDAVHSWMIAVAEVSGLDLLMPREASTIPSP